MYKLICSVFVLLPVHAGTSCSATMTMIAVLQGLRPAMPNGTVWKTQLRLQRPSLGQQACKAHPDLVERAAAGGLLRIVPTQEALGPAHAERMLGRMIFCPNPTFKTVPRR